jgi:DNA-binding response OmpR family regulator
VTRGLGQIEISAGITILVVDDEEEIRDLVASYLEREGYRILTAPDGASMWQDLEAHQVDLIVLDVLLPDADGFGLIRDLRRRRDIPIILLTGKSEAVDRVVGLEIGADDYLCKPFELRELLARVRSVWRRYRSNPPAPVDDRSPEVKVFAGWALDPIQRQLYSPAGVEVELTSGEFDLLRELVNNPKRPMTRDHLLDATQSRDWTPFDRSIDVSIGRLRKKLEIDPAHPTLIKTVRNVGYVLAANVTDENGSNISRN